MKETHGEWLGTGSCSTEVVGGGYALGVDEVRWSEEMGLVRECEKKIAERRENSWQSGKEEEIGKGLTQERLEISREGRDLVGSDEGEDSPGGDGSFVELPVDARNGDSGDLGTGWTGAVKEVMVRIVRGYRATVW
jgi:hypothetical protein